MEPNVMLTMKKIREIPHIVSPSCGRKTPFLQKTPKVDSVWSIVTSKPSSRNTSESDFDLIPINSQLVPAIAARSKAQLVRDAKLNAEIRSLLTMIRKALFKFPYVLGCQDKTYTPEGFVVEDGIDDRIFRWHLHARLASFTTQSHKQNRQEISKQPSILLLLIWLDARTNTRIMRGASAPKTQTKKQETRE